MINVRWCCRFYICWLSKNRSDHYALEHALVNTVQEGRKKGNDVPKMYKHLRNIKGDETFNFLFLLYPKLKAIYYLEDNETQREDLIRNEKTASYSQVCPRIGVSEKRIVVMDYQ